MKKVGKVQYINDLLKGLSANIYLNSWSIDYQSISSFKFRKYRNFALDHTIIIPEKNLLFTWIPKCACSTLKRTLYNYKGENKNSSFHLMDKLTRREKIKLIRKNKSLKKYALCREPMKRVLSCFLEKIVDSKFHQLQHITNYLGLYGYDASQIRFLDFLNALDYKNNIYLDSHWIPQDFFLIFPAEKYDRIFQLEEIDELKKHLAKINIEFIDDRHYKSPDGIREKHSLDSLKINKDYLGKEMNIVDLVQSKKKNYKPNYFSFWGKEEISIFKKLYSRDLYLVKNKIQI